MLDRICKSHVYKCIALYTHITMPKERAEIPVKLCTNESRQERRLASIFRLDNFARSIKSSPSGELGLVCAGIGNGWNGRRGLHPAGGSQRAEFATGRSIRRWPEYCHRRLARGSWKRRGRRFRQQTILSVRARAFDGKRVERLYLDTDEDGGRHLVADRLYRWLGKAHRWRPRPGLRICIERTSGRVVG